jgi:tetratricopeptide (TPR) repeat protein
MCFRDGLPRQLKARESPGPSGGRKPGGKRGWFTPAESDIDSYVAGDSRSITEKVTGDLEGAIADYTRALEFDPNFFLALLNRGIARKDSGDLSGAVHDWERFLELAPRHPQAAAFRAEIKKIRNLPSHSEK